MVIDDPFEGKEQDFGLTKGINYPSRSPSPERQKVEMMNIDFKETAFLEDDIQLEEMATKKTEEELKAEKATAEANSRKI